MKLHFEGTAPYISDSDNAGETYWSMKHTACQLVFNALAPTCRSIGYDKHLVLGEDVRHMGLSPVVASGFRYGTITLSPANYQTLLGK